MRRELWGMSTALTLALSSTAFAQQVEIEQPIQEQPIQEQPSAEQQAQPSAEQQTQPSAEQQTQPSAEQQAQPSAEQQTQPAEAQPPSPPPQQMMSDDVQLSELPPAVQNAIREEVGDGRIEDIERDRERGQTVYELEYVRDGIEYEVDFAEDGRVLEKHQD